MQALSKKKVALTRRAGSTLGMGVKPKEEKKGGEAEPDLPPGMRTSGTRNAYLASKKHL